MSSYFSFSALAKFALARAEQLNAIFSAIDVGFGKLPDPDALNQQRHNYVVAGGTANVLTATLPKAPAGYVEGLRLSVKVTATTTTDATINVNGLGAKPIVRANGDPTAANDLVAGQIVDMQYDGTAFRLIAASEVLAAASAAAAAASAAAADTSADAAANSATAADASADAAAASAADAASATKVAKAGDTMTGDLTLSNAALRITHATSVPSLYLTQNGAGFCRVRFAFTGQAGALFALRDETAGVDRLTIDATGAAAFSGSLAVGSTLTTTGGITAGGPIVRSTNWSMGLSGSNPLFTFDATDTFLYDRTANAGIFSINSTAILTYNSGGLSVTGGASFTAAVTAPTAAAGTNTTQLATTAFVQAAIANVIGAAPLALDTLVELSAALGNDANFATTTTNALALKAPLASPGLTGTPTAPTAADATNSTQIATTAYVQTRVTTALTPYLTSATAASTYAPLASPALTGNPTAPTPAAGDADTSIATTAFVDALRDLPQNAQAAGYTLALTDRAKHVYYSGAGGHSYTIPANATIAFPIGTTIVIINDGTGNLTLARAASVALRWAQTGADADRTLAPGGMATLLKVATNRWIVSGAGLT